MSERIWLCQDKDGGSYYSGDIAYEEWCYFAGERHYEGCGWRIMFDPEEVRQWAAFDLGATEYTHYMVPKP